MATRMYLMDYNNGPSGFVPALDPGAIGYATTGVSIRSLSTSVDKNRTTAKRLTSGTGNLVGIFISPPLSGNLTLSTNMTGALIGRRTALANGTLRIDYFHWKASDSSYTSLGARAGSVLTTGPLPTSRVLATLALSASMLTGDRLIAYLQITGPTPGVEVEYVTGSIAGDSDVAFSDGNVAGNPWIESSQDLTFTVPTRQDYFTTLQQSKSTAKRRNSSSRGR